MLTVKANQDYIAISKKLVEDVFPNTNAVFIKVYIHILMLIANGKQVAFADVANSLQLLESDVLQAVRYWENQGVLQVEEEEERVQYENAEVAENNADNTDSSSYDISDITSRIEGDAKLSEMIQISEQVLSSTLSTAEIKSLYWFYDKLSFSPEVILMLLEYCVSIGKKSMSYVEKVALGWNKRGINSIEAVEKFLSEEETKKNYMNNLKQVFGIRDRRLTGIEEDYLTKWHDTLGMPEELIALSYEYCILRINKISFPYMDRIIERWHEQGIFTIEAAERENENFKKSHENTDNNDSGFDILKNNVEIDELEKFTWDKLE